MRWLFVILALAWAAPVQALPVSLDFDDGIPGAAIEDFYAAHGVTFLNAAWHVCPCENTPPLGVLGLDGGAIPASNPIIALFERPIDWARVIAIDIGAAGFRMEAFADLSGTRVLAADEVFGEGLGSGDFLLSVIAPGIRRLEWYQPAYDGFDWAEFDDLHYEVHRVPEPATWVLLGLGVLSVGAVTVCRSRPA